MFKLYLLFRNSAVQISEIFVEYIRNVARLLFKDSICKTNPLSLFKYAENFKS